MGRSQRRATAGEPGRMSQQLQTSESGAMGPSWTIVVHGVDKSGAGRSADFFSDHAMTKAE